MSRSLAVMNSQDAPVGQEVPRVLGFPPRLGWGGDRQSGALWPPPVAAHLLLPVCPSGPAPTPALAPAGGPPGSHTVGWLGWGGSPSPSLPAPPCLPFLPLTSFPPCPPSPPSPDPLPSFLCTPPISISLSSLPLLPSLPSLPLFTLPFSPPYAPSSFPPSYFLLPFLSLPSFLLSPSLSPLLSFFSLLPSLPAVPPPPLTLLSLSHCCPAFLGSW